MKRYVRLFRPGKRALCLILIGLFLLCAAGAENAENAENGHVWGVIRDTEFGAVRLGCTPEEFLAAGFAIGDSCDLVFSNGFRVEDVPVFDGYYARSGCPVIALYPGYENPYLNFCAAGSMWDASGVSEEDTVRVTLREGGRYLRVQETLSTIYSNDPSDYGSDRQFANFRPLSGGRIRKDHFFRGATPIDDKFRRASAADALLRENGIGFILDLGDTRERAEAYGTYPGSYAAGLAAEGRVEFLGLNMAYTSGEFGGKLADGLRAMMKQEDRVYIHCTEGKDRTGFVCVLLEALAGADYDEITADYMQTYRNYYGLSEEKDPEKYAAVMEVKYLDVIGMLTGQPWDADFSARDLKKDAADYLLRAGMTPEEVNQLEEYLTAE